MECDCGTLANEYFVAIMKCGCTRIELGPQRYDEPKEEEKSRRNVLINYALSRSPTGIYCSWLNLIAWYTRWRRNVILCLWLDRRRRRRKPSAPLVSSQCRNPKSIKRSSSSSSSHRTISQFNWAPPQQCCWWIFNTHQSVSVSFKRTHRESDHLYTRGT